MEHDPNGGSQRCLLVPAMNPLDHLLESYRAAATSERAKGTAFENLVAAWLIVDEVQATRFTRVEPWAVWAERHNLNRDDTGIDLVGTLRNGSSVAIQCKFFAADRSIHKEDIDSFISASAKHPFAERLIVETTDVPWSDNAETMLHGQTIPTARIGLRGLRESQVNWSTFAATGELVRPKPKTLRPDQVAALDAVRAGLAQADRGKLIMACGTGKTLTALRIAEQLARSSGHVLLLMPSLALMAQTVREWCADATVPVTAFAACSDAHVGKRRRSRHDIAELEVTDLAFPPTTDAASLAHAIAATEPRSMRVVFATYHSISVIATAQATHGLPDFDLIICDEAHRTTGVTFAGEDQSNFVKVHDNDVIRGQKRLYMTATPRIYGENAKSKARDTQTVLASMDDPTLFGKVLFHHGFAQAVESGILTDYRVIVLAIDEGEVSTAVQNRLTDTDSELVLDDATKIVGCWKALSKTGFTKTPGDDSRPMRRALAFCRSIASSQLVQDEFEQVVTEFQLQSGDGSDNDVVCEVQHVDGTQNARDRGKKLDWLRENPGTDVCRILSNARCLTEGVDVPALDAILFLHPRNSQIDVVQAVGRVMRRAPNKRMGYVILPVAIPPGVPAHVALGDNEKYRVIWQILNALRAHDERLEALINQGGLGQDISGRIAVIDGRPPAGGAELQAVTARVEHLPSRTLPPGSRIGQGGAGDSQRKDERDDRDDRQEPLPLVIDDFSRAVMAKIVEKCGTRDYWEDWARDVAEIAERHITRIRGLVQEPESHARAFFRDFLLELRDDLNESITEHDAIEMLAQHVITRPVFDALFQGHTFVDRNPVSIALTEILSVIDETQIEREAKPLEGFYASVRRRATGVTDPLARQNLIVELYDKFFRNAFPRTTQRLGIVYTPVEIVDFILRSVNETLEREFGQTLGSRGVHILDPFAGTGTFITRLLQLDFIAPKDLERKYREELHANEIVLLAYYIAAINIETVLSSIAKNTEYLPYTGMCLTDTFALHEGDDQLSFYMKNNTARRERQKQTDIRVIVTNPPYSTGQKSQNDNAKNVAYAGLDERIRETYAKHSSASLVQNLYDSYIRAIRWGSDRLGKAGVMGFVSGSAWIERGFADGLRRCLAEEFASVHVFHLRGDIRKNMLSGGLAGEGENVFGQGSMTGIAVTVLVKDPNATHHGRILFHDIGNNLDRKQKLDVIKGLGSIRGIEESEGWTEIVPDQHGDWLDQRDAYFDVHIKMGDKKSRTDEVLFHNYSLGVVTNRDPWCINFSQAVLADNIRSTIEYYNNELARWKAAVAAARATSGTLPIVDDFVTVDAKRISWTRGLKQEIQKVAELQENDGVFVPCLYRPFVKQWQFFGRRLNEMVNQMFRVFPNGELPNRVIAVTGKGARSGFSALMMDALPNLHTIDTGQCFPLWLYETNDASETDLLGERCQGYRRVDAVTEYGIRHFRTAYPEESVSREDIFHYVYGLLHSEDYRSRFGANLSKELPRIPCVKSAADYRAFRDAGKRLGDLHVGYESVEPYRAAIETGGKPLIVAPEELYRVTKMRHPGSGKTKDRSTVIYNPYITIRDIPKAAWEYTVNGKAALAWVMERQRVKTDKASGIVNDANRYASETTGDPRYPLDLFLRIITVSLETTKVVRNLPDLVI